MTYIIGIILKIVDKKCLIERVSETYTIGGKRVRCTIDMLSTIHCRALDFDSEFSILKKQARRPGYLIVSEQPNKQGGVFMKEYSNSSNKKVSVKTDHIQEGFNALQKLLKEKNITSKFRDVINSLVYWGSIKGENAPTVNCLETSHRLRYLGCRESIKSLYPKSKKVENRI